MIGHVGKHLALNEIAPHLNNCGTCGLIGCSIEVFTKGRGNSKHDSAKSSCSNFPKNFSIHIAKKHQNIPLVRTTQLDARFVINVFGLIIWKHIIRLNMFI